MSLEVEVTASSVVVLEAGPEDREGWERFCASAGGTEFGHAWAYHELLAEVFGLEVIRLVAKVGDAWVAVLPLVAQRSWMGSFLTSVPYLNYAGVLGVHGEARRALALEAQHLARSRGVDRLELRGRSGADLPIDTWAGKSSFVLDLPPEPARLWDGLGSKVRAQARRPGKEGYEARVESRGGYRLFYPLLASRWHELGSPVLPERFFAELDSRLDGQVDYVIVDKAGSAVAAGLLVQSGSRVEIPWAASDLEHNRHGVNMLLYWTALERAIARGASRFDFGRSTPDSGNARFKLQWGAREEPLGWNVEARSRRGRSGERGAGKRELAAALWRRMPAFVARRLGPELARRIPL